MKLCITATGNDLSSTTEGAFGRAPWFLFIDTESGSVNAVQNGLVQAAQGAGIGAAQTLADNNVQALFTGKVGPKARAALSAAGIKIFEGLAQTTVQQALEQFRFGQSPESVPADQTQLPAQTAAAGCGQGMGRGGGGRGGCGGRGRGLGSGQGQCRRNKQ